MLKVLLQSIPSILFEPIAVGGVLGLVTAAVLFWRKKTAWYWSVAFALLFMISWRLAIQIISGRYASILIFPATIATAYFAYKMDWLAGFIPKFPEWLRKSLPYLTVIGIAIGGIGQLLHYNPYADRILKISELIKADAKQYKSTCILTHEERRLQYYTGLPVKPIAGDKINDDHFMKQIVLKKAPEEPAEVVYVVFPVSVNRVVEDYLCEVPAFIRKELVLLGEFYHNRKKRRVSRIYRYNMKKAYKVSSCLASKVEQTKNPVHKWLFQQSYPVGSSFYQTQLRYFDERESYLQKPVLKNFPVNWYVAWAGRFLKGNNGELGLITDSAGKIVFHLKSDAWIATANQHMMKARPFGVKITVGGNPGSFFTIGSFYYDKKWLASEQCSLVEVTDNQLRTFAFTQPYVPAGAQKMNIVLVLKKGEIFVHSIELYEVDEKK